LRDRLGELEDQFFSTVFFGSALLFLAMFFCSAAILGGLVLMSASATPSELSGSMTVRFARASAYVVMNVYAIKMAAVFMMSTSIVIMRTRIVPRWIAAVGLACALFLLFGSYYVGWSIVAFPAWVMLISVYIVIDDLRRPRERALVR
jgi:hypothetical protein